ncbi:MAG TPA: 2-hydroxyacyl-CoA dehydratase, partial [Candidatus Deferrimicrobium sp.]|nr:2-hydroxyacyl-CoA dehydratase [Candidatus Deferrimicrobium sp.]
MDFINKKMTEEDMAANRMKAWSVFREFSGEKSKQQDTLAASLKIKLPTTLAITVNRATTIRRAFRPGEKVAAISLLVPPEICWAAGFMPFNWEMFGTLLATHPRINDLVDRGSEKTPRCSFLNSLKGAFLKGLLPVPDVVLSSTGYCEAANYLFEELAGEFGVPQFHLDIPCYSHAPAIAQQTGQLRDVFVNLARLNGLTDEEMELRFREAIDLSVRAKQIYRDVVNLRREHPFLDLSLEPLVWHFAFFPLWGATKGCELCESLKKDIGAEIQEQEKKPNRGIPVGIFSQFPYGASSVWPEMIGAGAYTVYEGINCLEDLFFPDMAHIHGLPMEKLFEYLAVNLVNTPMRGGDIRGQSKKYMEKTKNAGATGFIIFSHDQCQLLAPRLSPVEKAAAAVGLEVCVINGDCITGVPRGQAQLRLKTFLSRLSQTRTKDQNFVLAKVSKRQYNAGHYRLGVDFGSGYSKYVVIDSQNRIIKKGMFHSGIDYPARLNEIMAAMPDEPPDRQYRIGITGMGGDNIQFNSTVHYQTTEINALITAVRYLLHNEAALLVVDIGSQDIKALKFANMVEKPWYNTNTSCGAGTG